MENIAQNKELTQKKEGYIYILKNPAMPNYVKIGKTNDIEQRLKNLNNSSAIPLSFSVYATYVVDNIDLVEREVHNLIDTINSNLRAREETTSGKMREREFFAISKEEAYDILLSIAKLRKDEKNLKINEKQSNQEKEEEKYAKVIEKRAEKQKKLSFSEYGIDIGSQLTYVKDESIIATVVNETKVEYQGERYSLSGLALKLAKEKNAWKAETIQGPDYFMYNGKKLTDIRKEIIKKEEEII